MLHCPVPAAGSALTGKASTEKLLDGIRGQMVDETVAPYHAALFMFAKIVMYISREFVSLPFQCSRFVTLTLSISFVLKKEVMCAHSQQQLSGLFRR